MIANVTLSARATANYRPLNSRLLPRGAALLLGMLGLWSGSTVAATFCVGTGNELASALETAANNGQNDEIRIRMGTLTRSGAVGTVPRWEYDLGAGTGDNDFALTMSGGWTDCSNQVIDPTLTVLDAQHQGTALYFQLYSSSGALQLSNFTVTRGQNNGEIPGRPAANLSISAPYSTANIVLERLIVVAGKATADTGSPAGVKLSGFDDGFGGRPTLTLRNSVIAYNTATNTVGVDIAMNQAVVYLSNNSIHSNTATNATSSTCRCAGLDITNDGVTYVSNNVVVNNVDGANRDSNVRNRVGNAYLRNNHIGNLIATVPPVINLAMTTGAPDWTFSGIYPIPNANSPLRDSGHNALVGGVGTVDLPGNARIINGTVDRGAVEAEAVNQVDLIFIDSFE